MNRTRQYNWLLKLSIVAVYLLFFTVQIFYNLESNRHLFNTQRSVTEYISNSGKQVKATVKAASAHTRSPHKLWLNKRYEPSSIPVPVVAMTELPKLIIEPLKIGSYTTLFYSSVFLSAHCLRGPPVVA